MAFKEALKPEFKIYAQTIVDNAKKFETELKLSIDNINKLSADQLNSLVSDLEKKMTFIYLEYAN